MAMRVLNLRAEAKRIEARRRELGLDDAQLTAARNRGPARTSAKRRLLRALEDEARRQGRPAAGALDGAEEQPLGTFAEPKRPHDRRVALAGRGGDLQNTSIASASTPPRIRGRICHGAVAVSSGRPGGSARSCSSPTWSISANPTLR